VLAAAEARSLARPRLLLQRLAAAARAGLREGDIILSINNAQTASVKELEAVLSKHEKSKPLTILFRRGEWTQYAVIKVNP
jgi:serine protease Do